MSSHCWQEPAASVYPGCIFPLHELLTRFFKTHFNTDFLFMPSRSRSASRFATNILYEFFSSASSHLSYSQFDRPSLICSPMSLGPSLVYRELNLINDWLIDSLIVIFAGGRSRWLRDSPWTVGNWDRLFESPSALPLFCPVQADPHPRAATSM
jgi:hypothetical protein